jgi:hypothetical protein
MQNQRLKRSEELIKTSNPGQVASGETPTDVNRMPRHVLVRLSLTCERSRLSAGSVHDMNVGPARSLHPSQIEDMTPHTGEARLDDMHDHTTYLRHDGTSRPSTA